jgi:hypothetical protein
MLNAKSRVHYLNRNYSYCTPDWQQAHRMKLVPFILGKGSTSPIAIVRVEASVHVWRHLQIQIHEHLHLWFLVGSPPPATAAAEKREGRLTLAAELNSRIRVSYSKSLINLTALLPDAIQVSSID